MYIAPLAVRFWQQRLHLLLASSPKSSYHKCCVWDSYFIIFLVTSLNALRSLLCVVNSSGCLETVSRNHIHAQRPDLQMKELVTAARVQGGQNIWTQWNCVDRRCHSQPPEQNVCVCVLVMGLTAVSNGSCLTGPWEMESKRSIRYNVNNDPSSHCAARDKSIKDPSPCRRHHPLPTAYRKKKREREWKRAKEWKRPGMNAKIQRRFQSCTWRRRVIYTLSKIVCSLFSSSQSWRRVWIVKYLLVLSTGSCEITHDCAFCPRATQFWCKDDLIWAGLPVQWVSMMSWCVWIL